MCRMRRRDRENDQIKRDEFFAFSTIFSQSYVETRCKDSFGLTDSRQTIAPNLSRDTFLAPFFRFFLPFASAAALLAAMVSAPSARAQQKPGLLPDGPGVPTITLNGSGAGKALEEPAPKPANQQSAWNMELVGHSDL